MSASRSLGDVVFQLWDESAHCYTDSTKTWTSTAYSVVICNVEAIRQWTWDVLSLEDAQGVGAWTHSEYLRRCLEDEQSGLETQKDMEGAEPQLGWIGSPDFFLYMWWTHVSKESENTFILQEMLGSDGALVMLRDHLCFDCPFKDFCEVTSNFGVLGSKKITESLKSFIWPRCLSISPLPYFVFFLSVFISFSSGSGPSQFMQA